ncbi:Rieske domain-containing protein, partial [Euroglyphus maynei]
DSNEQIPNDVRVIPGQQQPPSYPNGWIPILESRKLKRNELKSLLCFGRELVIVRVPSDQVYIFDAYCPHLGANLAIGGTIEQRHISCRNDNDNHQKIDCIVCPFHSWAFRVSDGNCVDVPYEDNVPNTKLKMWKCLEMNGIIFVWYHNDNSMVEPEWKPEKIAEIITGKWRYYGRTEHYTNCHIQEIPENGADVAHLNQIHSTSVIGSSNRKDRQRWLNRLVKHEWTAQWNPCPAPNQHISRVEMISITRIFGFKIIELRFIIRQIGPAYVEIHLKSDFFTGIEGVALQLVKPIRPMRNSIIHNFYFNHSIFSFIFSKIFMFSVDKMLIRDIEIWNRKAFLQRPFVGKSEKSLVKFRRWFKQFYSNDDNTNHGHVKHCDW